MTVTAGRRGRPLRFLALVSMGWVAMRVAILWPRAEPLAEIASPVPAAMAESLPPQMVVPVRAVAPQVPASPARLIAAVRAAAVHRVLALPLMERAPPVTAIAVPFMPNPTPSVATPVLATVAAQPFVAPPPRRWSASGWLMLRQGGAPGVAPGGQLGGSQAGVRLAYVLVAKRRIALFGRFVTPLSGPGREATIGLEWQPTRAPVRLVAEQRFAIDGGKGGPGVGLVAGFDRELAGFRLETYGQAGAIRRDRIEPYADGAARVTRRIGHGGFAIGAGAWGAAQRDAQRLDLGPSATLTVPIARHSFRLALDWRQRVAGSARPGSGVALTLGSDF